MDTHPLSTAKDRAAATMLANTPIEFTTTCTISGTDLDTIKAKSGGHVLLFKDMIDNYSQVELALKKQVASAYSLLEPEKLDLNFLLTDLYASDLQTMDSAGGLVVGASLAFPSIDGISHCLEVNDGTWRKIHDLDRPGAFILGEQHAFIHPLKHNSVERTYPLITAGSRTLPQVMYPNMKLAGVNPCPVQYRVRPDQSLEVHQVGPVLLHGHHIKNSTAYTNDLRPVVAQYLRPMPGEAIQTEYHTHLPLGSYQKEWWNKRPEYQKENGCLVPIDEYTQATYDFMDQLNSNRATNFSSSGLWWNAQLCRPVPCMKFNLKFRVVPIIEAHRENAEQIPFANQRRHLRSLMVHTDKTNLN